MRPSIILPLMLAAALLAPARPAAAQPKTDRIDRRPWYGWQILVVDGLSIGAIAIASSDQADVMAPIGVLGLALGAPIVHAVRGHYGRAAGSLLMRPGLVALGGYIGYKVKEGCVIDRETGCLDPMAYGLLGGAVIAGLVDTFVLAWEPTARVAPVVTPTNGGATFGLAGAF